MCSSLVRMTCKLIFDLWCIQNKKCHKDQWSNRSCNYWINHAPFQYFENQ